jgi:hypothetical protein
VLSQLGSAIEMLSRKLCLRQPPDEALQLLASAVCPLAPLLLPPVLLLLWLLALGRAVPATSGVPAAGLLTAAWGSAVALGTTTVRFIADEFLHMPGPAAAP